MPRSPVHSDAFNAIAEPRRRQIIEHLARHGEQPVTALVEALDLAQPSVSKHLAVLRQVGIVAVTRRGRERVYRLEPRELKVVHDWAGSFERLWSHQLSRVAERAASRARVLPAADPARPGAPAHRNPAPGSPAAPRPQEK